MNVFLLTPPVVATGGIELLHQLAYELNKHEGVIATIMYSPRSKEQEGKEIQPRRYTEKYNSTYFCIDNFSDPSPLTEEDWVIFPEVAVAFTFHTYFSKAKKIIYWESVDNYYAPTPQRITHIFPKGVLHLTQSEYAYDFLTNFLNIPKKQVLFLTDYLNDAYFEPFDNSYSTKRAKVVAWNPAKSFNKNIISHLEEISDIVFVPISNLSQEEVIDLLHSCMIYADFGNHPGKDRLPREAAMCGCCVITGKRGAAAKKEGDVFIPEEYKFNEEITHPKQVIDKIKYIFDNFENCSKDFDEYRERIKKEKEEFRKEVKQLVKRMKKEERKKIMSQKRVRVPKKPLPSAKKIATRGLYEILWGGKKRDYGKRVGTK